MEIDYEQQVKEACLKYAASIPVGQSVKLSNGLIAGNFSSPHPFTFEDGSVIPAVNDIDSERLKVNFIETTWSGSTPYTITLKFELSSSVRCEMERWQQLHKDGKVDVVLCCLPMIQALKEMKDFSDFDLLNSPFRAVRMKDRIKKLISIDTFTI